MESSMKSTFPRIALCACLAVSLTACTGGPGPDQDALEAELVANHLPASWTLESQDVSAQENMGTEVEPMIASRVLVALAPQQDIHKRARKSQPVDAEGGT